jgi:hypothetical protein
MITKPNLHLLADCVNRGLEEELFTQNSTPPDIKSRDLNSSVYKGTKRVDNFLLKTPPSFPRIHGVS